MESGDGRSTLRDGGSGDPRHSRANAAEGQNVTAVISSLVDSALLRYSKDVLARPDYALYTSCRANGLRCRPPPCDEASLRRISSCLATLARIS
jgi:hypothetical protein